MSQAQQVIDYIGSLTVRRGAGQGKPFKVLPWQRSFIRGVFGRGRRLNALTCPRANGKTALMGAIAACMLDDRGPFGGEFQDVVSLARTFPQAGIVFDFAVSLLPGARDTGPDRRYRIQDNRQHKTLRNIKTGSEMRVLAADPGGKGLQGLGFSLALCDEPREWIEGNEVWDVMRTALGKSDTSRLIAFGVMPVEGSASGKWFVDLFVNPDAFSVRYEATKAADPLHWKTVKRANPSVDHFKGLADTIKEEIRAIKRDGEGLPAFKALRLNLGTSTTDTEEMLMTPDAWKEHVELPAADLPERVGECFVGIDLGGSASMTAAAGYWPASGRLEVCAWHPALSYHNKESKQMAARGELILTPGHVVDVSDFIPWAFDRFGCWPAAVACDRWREAELLQALRNLAEIRPEIRRSIPSDWFDWRGQGYRDGGEDVRRFLESCLSGRVKVADNLLMRYAIAVSKVLADPAGNKKLVRLTKAKGMWNDGLAAAILAVSLGRRRTDQGQTKISFYPPGRKTDMSKARRGAA